MKSIFITGATGFVGRNFLRRLNQKSFYNITCLSRNLDNSIVNSLVSKNIQFIQGDIFDFHLYSQYLSSCDLVVHMAAVTGKAEPEQYFKVNDEGTHFLLSKCAALKVKRFLHISTIAVNFNDISKYYYAKSKKAGEDAVKRSGLKYSIVRPTIVIGKESLSWKNLIKLSKGPIIWMPEKGKTKIQPIFIEDLAEFLTLIIKNDVFQNEIYDIGGPEVIRFYSFLKIIQRKYRGSNGIVLNVPIHPFIFALSALEKFFYSYLPINSGQLTPFINDSVIEQNALLENLAFQMKNVEQMLDIAINLEKQKEINKSLLKESEIFTRYFMKITPNNYVKEKYIDGHKNINFELKLKLHYFERLLIFLSRIHPLGTKIVDIYASVFLRQAIIRKKLILLLAILECSHPFYLFFDKPSELSQLSIILKSVWKMFSFSMFLLLGILTLAPIHIALIFFRNVNPKKIRVF